MKTIVGLFDQATQADKAARDLAGIGIVRSDISIVASNETQQHAAHTTAPHAADVVTHDAVVGAEVGAAAGFLIGLTALAIPGLGWIAGAGWLMGTLYGAGTGAVIGGIVGGLTMVGVPREDAELYNEGVKRGGTLIAVKSPDDRAAQVAEILSSDGAVDINERADCSTDSKASFRPVTPAQRQCLRSFRP